MSSTRYTQAFREEALRLIKEEKLPVCNVSQRLGVSTYSLYKWLRSENTNELASFNESNSLTKELNLLKEQLQAISEERNILKKAQAYFRPQHD